MYMYGRGSAKRVRTTTTKRKASVASAKVGLRPLHRWRPVPLVYTVHKRDDIAE